MSEPVLDLAGVRVTYRSHDAESVALHGADLTLRPGTRYGIVGESGSGKSTIIRALLGLVRAPSGVEADHVTLRGVGDLTRLPEARLRQVRGKEIGYVGQNPFGLLHPVIPLHKQFHNYLSDHDATSGRRDSRERSAARLAELGIPDPERVLAGHAGQLSGGMAQRVVIALATLLSPQLLVADEPTTALDVTVQRQVLDLIAPPDLHPDRALLLVTHDLAVVAQHCDEVVVMYGGRVVETGPLAQVFDHPLHPYTATLLASVPGAAPTTAVPHLGARTPRPSGCRFAARCDAGDDRCAVRPDLLPQQAGRTVACHRSAEMAQQPVRQAVQA